MAAAAVLVVASVAGYFATRSVPPPRVLRTAQLTNTNPPKSGVVTDGARLYFVEGQSKLSEISVTGGETYPMRNALEDTGFAECVSHFTGPIDAADEQRQRVQLWTVLCGRCRCLEVRRDAWEPRMDIAEPGRRTVRESRTARATKYSWRTRMAAKSDAC